jgi:hypothetical protein
LAFLHFQSDRAVPEGLVSESGIADEAGIGKSALRMDGFGLARWIRPPRQVVR